MEVTLDGENLTAAETCWRGLPGCGCRAGRRCLDRDRGRPMAGGNARGFLRDPDRLSRAHPGRSLQGTLRPYQQAGVEWLDPLVQLKLGACLADDMGLGKTIQVLSLLLVLKHEAGRSGSPACSWRRLRCSPTGRRRLPDLRQASRSSSPIHQRRPPRTRPRKAPRIWRMSTWSLQAMASWPARRGSERQRGDWWCLIGAGDQESRRRVDQNGQVAPRRNSLSPLTPIEHRLGDLWSIFICIIPIVGIVKGVFVICQAPRRPAAEPVWPAPRSGAPRYLATDEDRQEDHWELPDKTEVKTFCPLSRKQGHTRGRRTTSPASSKTSME